MIGEFSVSPLFWIFVQRVECCLLSTDEVAILAMLFDSRGSRVSHAVQGTGCESVDLLLTANAIQQLLAVAVTGETDAR